MDVNLILNFISANFLGLNWVDLIIIIIVAIYAIEGGFLGFLAASIDLVSFVLSFILGLSFYGVIAKLFVIYFKMPQGFANALGFLILAVVFEIAFSLVLKKTFSKLRKSIPLNSRLNLQAPAIYFTQKFLGFLPGALSGLVLCSFILSLIIALPFSLFLKNSVTEAKIGNFLVGKTQVFATNLGVVFGGAVNDTLSFLTIEPKSNESVSLNFKTDSLSVDKNAEAEMFRLTNKERTERGINALTFSESLAEVGRKHCSDMFRRGYFSHYTPEGLSPFDRMVEGSIIFNSAGENLALSPNPDLAMKGLMESEGHRKNILSREFGKVGIGVIDGGIYGQMYCQEFSD